MTPGDFFISKVNWDVALGNVEKTFGGPPDQATMNDTTGVFFAGCSVNKSLRG